MTDYEGDLPLVTIRKEDLERRLERLLHQVRMSPEWERQKYIPQIRMYQKEYKDLTGEIYKGGQHE